jgi:hypothetical protein
MGIFSTSPRDECGAAAAEFTSFPGAEISRPPARGTGAARRDSEHLYTIGDEGDEYEFANVG